MRTIRNIAFATMAVLALGSFASPAAASQWCNPDPWDNSDCGPWDVCDPSTGECTEDCYQNPDQCNNQMGTWCQQGGCIPIG